MKTHEQKVSPVLLGLLFLFFLLFHSSFSQETDTNDSERKFRIGPKIGLNYATLTPDYFYNKAEGIVGLHLGAVTYIPLTTEFYLQPELMYSRQGATLITPEGYEEEREIDYITISAVVGYEIIQDLDIQLGPQIGTVITIFGEDFDLFDYGIIGGIQYNLSFHFFAQGRYYLGLQDIGVEGYNRVASLSVGYLF